MGKHKNRSNKTSGEKETPIAVTLLLILLCVSVFLLFCIGTGVMIDAIVAFITGCVKPDETRNYMLRIVPVGILYIILLIAYCLDGIPGLKKTKGESYREDIVGMFLIVMGFTAVVLMALASHYGRYIDGVIGTLILPAIGIAITPKRVKKAIEKMKKWERSKNNISNIKDNESFYKVKTTEEFEKKLYRAVFFNQFKNLFIAIGGAVLLIAFALFRFSHEPTRSGKRADRSALLALVILIGIAIFGIPVFAVYLTNSICILKIVKNHKYEAYHVIAKSADDKKVHFKTTNGIRSLEYPVCVGIRKRDVHDTKATLVLMPDFVMVFPDEGYEYGKG